jgi:hypothetical protein
MANQALFGEHDDVRLVDVAQVIEPVGEAFQARSVDVLVDFRGGDFLQAPADFGLLHAQTS